MNLSFERIVPPSAIKLIVTLCNYGYPTYLVGGCVRDILRNRTPKDWDITTAADPIRVCDIFEDFVPTGINHGTVTVYIDGDAYEVTTMRRDGDYVDGRHPAEVVFCDSIIEDLSRRDFTINAMALGLNGTLIDPFGGADDLVAGIVRTVGDAKARFTEDKLRILRALRFAITFGYDISEDTFAEICAMTTADPTLGGVSAERVLSELLRSLHGIPRGPVPNVEKRISRSQAFLKLMESVLNYCKPGLGTTVVNCTQNNPHHAYNVGLHTYTVCRFLPDNADDALVMAAFLHDVGKPLSKTVGADGVEHFYKHAPISVELADQILTHLKGSTALRLSTLALIAEHSTYITTTKHARHLISRIGTEPIENFLSLRFADIMGHSNFEYAEKMLRYQVMCEVCRKIVFEQGQVTTKTLALSGQDILNAGIVGKDIGKFQRFLVELVLDEVIKNEKKPQEAILAAYKAKIMEAQ